MVSDGGGNGPPSGILTRPFDLCRGGANSPCACVELPPTTTAPTISAPPPVEEGEPGIGNLFPSLPSFSCQVMVT